GSMTITSRNDAPVLSGANNFTTITEDQTTNGGDLISTLISGKVTDVDSGALQGIAVIGLVSSTETWQYSIGNGTTWNAVGTVANNLALLLRSTDRLRFVPDGLNGTTASVTFRAWDQTSGTQGTKVDTTTNGGTTAFSTATASSGVTVTSVNDAPHGANNTVTTLEETPYVFHAADFGFSDPNDSPANNFLAVEITTLPGAGTLTDNGVAVTAGQFVSVSDINAGRLVFTPAANANGTGYASFTFQVQDDGGTASGGVDTDP